MHLTGIFTAFDTIKCGRGIPRFYVTFWIDTDDGRAFALEEMNTHWSQVLKDIKQEISPVSFETWIVPIKPLALTDNVLRLSVPGELNKDIITTKFRSLLESCIADAFGAPYTMEVVCDTPGTAPAAPSFDTIRSQNTLNPKYSFESFVVGNNNNLAHAASLAVAESPSQKYNPLFIYGGSGLGKTHLLQAVGNYFMQHYPDKKVLYTTSEKFTYELVTAIREKSNQAFRNKHRTVDLLLMDDIQFLATKELAQEEFFHTFNALYDARKQIVLTSDRPPKEIKTLEDRLRSRFEQDLIADIQPPDLETRIAIIKRKAELDGVEISDEVCEYVASKIKANIRQLEGTVKKIKAKYYLDGEKPTINSVQGIISDILNNDAPPEVTVERIIDEVARTYGVSADEIRSQKNRSANISNARHIAIYVTRELTTLSMVAIGEEFGNRHYSTIIYTIQKVQKMMEKDRKVKEIIDDTIKNIRDR